MQQNITERFLTALFGQDEDTLSFMNRILVWSVASEGNKHSFFAQSINEAVIHAQKIGQRRNVYFGCGLQPNGLEHYQRGKPNEIRGIPGIWADIDYISPKAHNKKNLAPSLDDAIALACSMPLLPTLIVLSGHGIQPWWLFKEFWLFEGEDGGRGERQKAAEAVAGWQHILKGIADARGWEHDATHDLSRVMRLPGTYNLKDPEDIRQVEVAHWNDARRFNPDDFEGYLIFDWISDDFEAEGHVAEPTFVPRRDAGLPPHFVMLMEETPRLALTWNRKRRDMRDTSHSGFDMALAGFMAAYGNEVFSDQDIADVIAAQRNRFCDEGSKEWKKGHSRDYISRTIKRARVQRYREMRENQILNTLDEGVPMENITADSEAVEQITGEITEEQEVKTDVRIGKPDLSHAEKAKKIAALSIVLKVKILAVRRYLSDPPQYELVMPKTSVRVGDIGKLIGQGELRKALAAAAGVVIPNFKSDKWHKTCQGLLDCIDDIEVGDEATESGICRAWITQYLEENKPSRDAEGACRARRPFLNNEDKVCLFLESFREWLLARQERIKSNELAVILRRYGCTPSRFKVRPKDPNGNEGKETTRSVYMLPED